MRLIRSWVTTMAAGSVLHSWLAVGGCKEDLALDLDGLWAELARLAPEGDE